MLIYTVPMPEDENEQNFILAMYEQYKYIMFQTAKKFESAADRAEDLIQEVLVKLIEKAPVLMSLEDHCLASYIIQTIRNTAANRIRSKRTSEKYIDARELTEEAETSLQQWADRVIEDDVLRSLESDELWSIFESLPDRTQLLLRGKYQFSLDDAELARLIGCRPDSIRMMLTRARRQALELLVKEGYHELT